MLSGNLGKILRLLRSRNVVTVDYADGFLFEEMHLGRICFAALGEMCVMSLIRNCYSREKERKQICGELFKGRSLLVVDNS